MMETFLDPRQLLLELGERLRDLRLRRGLDQAETAARAGVAVRTLRALERGQGSSTETLVRVLKALEALQGLEALAPRPSVSPLALLEGTAARRRVRRRKAAP